MPGATVELKQQMNTLNISEAAKVLDDVLREAETKEVTYREFLNQLLKYELKKREERQLEKRLKWATFPEYKPLEAFNLAEQQSLSKKQLQQLRELLWIEQAYSLIMLGPPGVGNYAK